MLQISNVDGITTEDELTAAIHDALGTNRAPDKVIVHNLHAWPDGTQSANILAQASILLKKGKIKVGWLLCPVKAKERPIRCFRCHGFDHRKASCQGADNSKCCWRCGSSLHHVQDCTTDDLPKCYHCIELNDNGDVDYYSGSKRCRVLRPKDHGETERMNKGTGNELPVEGDVSSPTCQ